MEAVLPLLQVSTAWAASQRQLRSVMETSAPLQML